MSRFNIIEEAYVLKKLEDSKNIRHQPGTNEYVFDYNYQWRNIYNQYQKLGIRSVKLWKSPRYIWIDEIPLMKDTGELKDIFVNGMIEDTTLNGTKSLTTKAIMNGQTVSADIKIMYNILNKSLTFETVNGWYFNKSKLDDRLERDKQQTNPELLQESEDFRAITGRKFAEGTPTYTSSGKMVQMIFYDVWDREDVHVYASFSDLATDGFLGVSNEQFIPPKEYPVNNSDQKFKLYLYDKLDRPIELSNDGKDTLIVEAMMCSYN